MQPHPLETQTILSNTTQYSQVSQPNASKKGPRQVILLYQSEKPSTKWKALSIL